MKPPTPANYRRATSVFVAIILTASVSGYFMGLRQTGSQISMTRPASPETTDPGRPLWTESVTVPTAVAYARLDWVRDGANGGWRNRLENLVPPPPTAAPTNTITPGQRARAVEERASRRAFDGAPPVVPHPVHPSSVSACIACHGPGLAVKDKVASRISHEPFTSCTQCHVPAHGPRLALQGETLTVPLASNDFSGMFTPVRGNRAWPSAPPTVPHPTWMRGDCLSCHGPRGLFGLRTPHPERVACTQCHAPNADLDQHQFGLSTPTTPAPQ